VNELTRYEKFVAGLTLLNGYEEKEIFAEHDVVGVYVEDISHEDAYILTEEFGWVWSDEYESWEFYV